MRRLYLIFFAFLFISKSLIAETLKEVRHACEVHDPLANFNSINKNSHLFTIYLNNASRNIEGWDYRAEFYKSTARNGRLDIIAPVYVVGSYSPIFGENYYFGNYLLEPDQKVKNIIGLSAIKPPYGNYQISELVEVEPIYNQGQGVLLHNRLQLKQGELRELVFKENDNRTNKKLKLIVRCAQFKMNLSMGRLKQEYLKRCKNSGFSSECINSVRDKYPEKFMKNLSEIYQELSQDWSQVSPYYLNQLFEDTDRILKLNEAKVRSDIGY